MRTNYVSTVKHVSCSLLQIDTVELECILNLCDEEKKNFQTKQNAGGMMTKMTDEKGRVIIFNRMWIICGI
jgi:hypothetical protein